MPFAILLAASALRLYGLDWDGGSFYHPDERSIFLRAEQMHRTLIDEPGWQGYANRDFPLDEPGFPSPATLFDADRSPLNPHWFPLGSIIIYLLVGVRFLLEPFMEQVRIDDLAIAGRTIAALIDTAAVLMLYALGARVFGRGVGLLAAVLGAFAAFGIQLAHIYRPEPFVVLLALASFWAMLNVLERKRRRDHLYLGLIIGLSFAFRSTSLPLLIPLAVTYGVLALRAYRESPDGVLLQRVRPIILRALGAGAAAFVVFALLQPYALLDVAKFVEDQVREAGIGRTAGTVPYTLQYVGEGLGVYELRQSAVWGLGLPLGIVAWTGLVLSAARVIGASRWGAPAIGEVLMVAWVVPFVLALMLLETKFLRYMAPVLPVMVLLGARWLHLAPQWLAKHSPALSTAAVALAAFVVGATAFFGIAFVRTYGEPHPAIAASEWVNENVPAGSTILTDNHWDEGFPNLGRYWVDQLRMYEGDSVLKVAEVAGQLANADYVMSYSNRVFGSITRLPERYPSSSALYRLLFDGKLGYRLERAFERYPTLANVSFAHDPFTRAGVAAPDSLPGTEQSGLALNLGYADENVTNYDRPLVLVWANEGRLGAEEIRERVREARATPPEPALLSAEAAAEQQAGGTWSTIFDTSGLNRAAPWLVWLAAIELIFLVTLPLASRLLRRLPDNGLVLARPLGLLLVAWLVWLGASVGVWSFSQQSVGIAILLVAGASALVVRRQWRLLARLVRRRWRYFLTAEVLFLVAFFVFLAVRAANPDLWHAWRGGEKPMDLSYLTAIVRSSTFPPYDPWYAGGYINYYYFGFVIVGVLIKATGIVPEIAYNLAVPLLFALTVTSVFAVGYNLAEAVRWRRYRHTPAWTPVLAGVAAALLVAVLANLDGAAQLVQGAVRVYQGEAFGAFDFWRSSRLMPGQISITEFPYWTFLFADLHAHLIAIPFAVLALGSALNTALSGGGRGWTGRAGAVGVTAFAVGSLAAINTWDVPAFGLLGLGAVLTMVLTGRSAWPIDRLWKAAGWGLAFWLLLYFLWLPFHQDYLAPYAGLKFGQWRTVLWHYLGIHGLLLLAAGSWLGMEAYGRLLARRRSAAPRAIALAIALAVVVAVVASVSELRAWLTVAVLAAFGAATLALLIWWLGRLRTPDAPIHILMLGMLGMAFAIGVGVDFVTVENDIDRMNTVFKTYLNAWVLFGIVGGVGLWQLWASGRLRLDRAIWLPAVGVAAALVAIGLLALLAYWLMVAALAMAAAALGAFVTRSALRDRSQLGLAAARGWAALLLLAVLSASVFPILGTKARLADRFGPTALTLDGRAYQQLYGYVDPGPNGRADSPLSAYDFAGDAEALDYMRDNISGSPVVMEAVTTQYRWTPRVAVYTGLPVVVGWEWHQIQQRGEGGAVPANVLARVSDVRWFYSTPDPAVAMSLVDQYNVSYIYVGATERLYFGEDVAEGFEGLVGERLDRFFANETVTVYRVREQAN